MSDLTRPLELTGHRLSVLRWHMARARAEEASARATENIDISSDHLDRMTGHLRAILGELEGADQSGDLRTEAA